MRYYIDLAKLAVWIGLFIHILTADNSPFVFTIAIIALISCICHGVEVMFEHDVVNYYERKHQDENKEEENE